MGYCARHMSRNRGLVFRSQAFHISISSSFWAFVRKEVMLSRTQFSWADIVWRQLNLLSVALVRSQSIIQNYCNCFGGELLCLGN